MVDIPGLDKTSILTNQNIFDLTDVPEKLLIIGGGPIGLEMAQAFALLGSTVTIVERATEFARLEDPAIRPVLHRAFSDLDITLLTAAAVTTVDGQTAYIDQTNVDGTINKLSVEFNRVLVAIGRVPNLPLGLPIADVDADVEAILVNSQYRTSNHRIYAVGDVAQKLKFTHTADDTARQVVAHVASRGLIKVKRTKAVPKVTYTSPEMAQVGLSHDAANQKYNEDLLMRIEVPFTNNDRAKTDSLTDGVLVVIAKRISGKILGAHIVGPAAGDLLAVFTLAIDNNLSLWKLQKTIYAYPTYSLIIKKAADQFIGRQLGDLKRDLLNLFKRHALKLFAAVVWIVAIITIVQYQNHQGLSPTETSIQIFNFIALTAWGPLLYILIYAIRPVTFFPATALTILSGIFFGFWWGTVYTLIAATLASAVAYTVGRFFSSNVHLEDTALGTWITTLQQNTFSTILTMRLIFLPFDLVSYAAGILRATFVPFITGTFLGILLGTATFVSIGAALDIEAFKEDGISFSLFNPTFLLLAVVIFILSLGVSKLVKRWSINR
jgi:uncharacterized membrane protein YdjX (TVP38/TMEM64 family)/NAD(P)-dependent dehydrogenase (short-subunit alcohol dehydrogenase family)